MTPQRSGFSARGTLIGACCLLLTLGASCAHLYVYVPGSALASGSNSPIPAGDTDAKAEAQPPTASGPAPGTVAAIKVVASYEADAAFARHRGSIFSNYSNNHGGPIEELVEGALRSKPDQYVRPGERLTVDIREFVLESEESLFQGRTRVKLRVGILRGPAASREVPPDAPAEQGVPPAGGKSTAGDTTREFTFEGQIDSAVGDLSLIATTVTLVGVLFYAPYLGFRGSITDQLNYLGRSALQALFAELAVRESEAPK